MSLGKVMVEQVLARPWERVPVSRREGLYTVAAAEGPLQARVELADADRLGCVATSIQVERTALFETGSSDQTVLRARAEQLTKRLTYLLEDLDIIEISSGNGICQIRSSPPEIIKEGTSYYELILEEKGRATLVRYEKCAGVACRIPKSMSLTLEVLRRLVDDLATVV